MVTAIAVAAAVSFASCDTKEKNNDPETPNYEYDVYVVGDDDGIPVYWKNGIRTALQYDTTNDYSTYAQYIVLSDGDFHIAGYEYRTENNAIMYWKNGGKPEYLTADTGSADADGIAIMDGDIYITGSNNDKPVYWTNKDGDFKETELATDGSTDAICVDGSTIYIAGYVYGTGSDRTPVIWKNGVKENFAKPDAGIEAMAVDGGNVYTVINYENSTEDGDVYALWKNGSEIFRIDLNPIVKKFIEDNKEVIISLLESSSEYDEDEIQYIMDNLDEILAEEYLEGELEIGGIAVENGNVYIAASLEETPIAFYIKNETYTLLPVEFTISTDIRASGITVMDGHVFVSGIIYDEDIPVYWKDGVMTKLPAEGEGDTYDIAVVRQANE